LCEHWLLSGKKKTPGRKAKPSKFDRSALEQLNELAKQPRRRKKGDKARFYCRVCEYNTPKKSHLSLHIKQVHLGKSKRFKCLLLKKLKPCTKSFHKSSGIRRHLKFVHEVVSVAKQDESMVDVWESLENII